jgi:hypothetical protein
MIGRIIRVLLGFAAACLAAGLALVLFVYTPPEVAGLSSERMAEVGLLALAAATHCAIFAAPFALIAVAFGESRDLGSWTYYVLVGIAIAVIGFLMWHFGENAGQPTILNNYALTAYMTSGFVGGLAYWLIAGRYARGPAREPEISRPKPAPPAAAGPAPTITVSPNKT